MVDGDNASVASMRYTVGCSTRNPSKLKLALRSKARVCAGKVNEQTIGRIERCCNGWDELCRVARADQHALEAHARASGRWPCRLRKLGYGGFAAASTGLPCSARKPWRLVAIRADDAIEIYVIGVVQRKLASAARPSSRSRAPRAGRPASWRRLGPGYEQPHQGPDPKKSGPALARSSSAASPRPCGSASCGARRDWLHGTGIRRETGSSRAGCRRPPISVARPAIGVRQEPSSSGQKGAFGGDAEGRLLMVRRRRSAWR